MNRTLGIFAAAAALGVAALWARARAAEVQAVVIAPPPPPQAAPQEWVPEPVAPVELRPLAAEAEPEAQSPMTFQRIIYAPEPDAVVTLVEPPRYDEVSGIAVSAIVTLGPGENSPVVNIELTSDVPEAHHVYAWSMPYECVNGDCCSDHVFHVEAIELLGEVVLKEQQFNVAHYENFTYGIVTARDAEQALERVRAAALKAQQGPGTPAVPMNLFDVEAFPQECGC